MLKLIQSKIFGINLMRLASRKFLIQPFRVDQSTIKTIGCT